MPFLKFLLRTALFAGIGIVLLIVGFVLVLLGNGPLQTEVAAYLSILPLIGGTALVCLSPVISIVIAIGKRQGKRRAETNTAQQAAVEAVRQRLLDAVDKHEGALRRNLRAAVKRNDYGTIIEDKTETAIDEFIDSIDFEETVREVISSLRQRNLKFEVHLGNDEINEIIQTRLNDLHSERVNKEFDPTSLPFDGNAFEDWVATALQKFGWDAKTTSGGADQGIDVLATKNGRTLALQCKLYSSAVGNKAVQEAFSGAAHYEADAAAVITNANYTSSAEKLASTTGVKLFSHYDIPNIYKATFEQYESAQAKTGQTSRFVPRNVPR